MRFVVSVICIIFSGSLAIFNLRDGDVADSENADTPSFILSIDRITVTKENKDTPLEIHWSSKNIPPNSMLTIGFKRAYGAPCYPFENLVIPLKGNDGSADVRLPSLSGDYKITATVHTRHYNSDDFAWQRAMIGNVLNEDDFRERVLARDDSNHPRNYVILGLAYANSPEMQNHMQIAIQWLEYAAKAGDPWAMVELGRILADENKADESVEWYHRAAALKYSQAEWLLGACYMRGMGVEKNLDRAMSHLKIAADMGHAEAMFAMGSIMQQLDEPEVALQFFNNAALAGSDQSLLALLEELETGKHQKPADFDVIQQEANYVIERSK